jgi:hypothetical protein
MSNLNESTPLLYDHGRRDVLDSAPFDDSISARSLAVLNSLETNIDAPIALGPGPVELVVLLHGIHLLSHFVEELEASSSDRSIAANLARGSHLAAIEKRLVDEVKRVLATWGQQEVDDEFLYEALWQRWAVNEGHVRTSGELPLPKLCRALRDQLLIW